jgi:hypothetical protein
LDRRAWEGEKAIPKPDRNPNAQPPDFGPPAPYLRKDFRVDKEVESAVAFVTGLGYFELWLNGAKVGDDVLVPNQTNYGKRPGLINASINVPDDFREYKVMYLAYEVKEQLNQERMPSAACWAMVSTIRPGFGPRAMALPGFSASFIFAMRMAAKRWW